MMTVRLPLLAGLAAACAPFALVTAASGQTIVLGPVLQHAEPDGVWVMWEGSDSSPGTVRYGLTPTTLGGFVVSAQTPGLNGSRIHHARIPGLRPDTGYFYAVTVGGVQSATYRLVTPPLPSQEKPFRFVAYSDTQGGSISNKHSEVVNQGIIGFTQANFGPSLEDELAFLIEPGDLVDNGGVYSQWKTQYFDENGPLVRHIPLYPVPGNHDYFAGTNNPNADARFFFDYFRLPENGTPGFLEKWWYKDYSNVRLIGIDTNTPSRLQQQLDWLDGVLLDAEANAAIDFVFAQMHHPHVSELWSPGNTTYTGEVVRRLEAFSTRTGKPSIHFYGHTHGYERGQSRDHYHLYVNVAAGEGNIDYWGLVPPNDYDVIQKAIPDWGFVLMEVQAGNDPQFRLRRVSRGNNVVAQDNLVTDDLTIRLSNAAPAVPTPVSPTSFASGINAASVTLDASAFVDPDGSTHLESHFQITAVPGDYSTPIDRWLRIENLNAPPGASGQSNGFFSVDTVTDKDITRAVVTGLTGDTVYGWRVRYRDSGLAWSEWSAESVFTTGTVPIGACCLPESPCTVQTESACVALGGSWAGPGTSCAQVDCPVPSVLFSEDFSGVTLGPSVDESLARSNVWSQTPPPGWIVDDSGVPTVNDPSRGMTEWEGWAFTDPAWWSQIAGDQLRSQFTRGVSPIAVADPDEWNDRGNPIAAGPYNALLTTPSIGVTSAAPGTLALAFDSSWRPESPQRAELRATFDTGQTVVLLDWRSSGPLLKPDATNERVTVPVALPAGASSVRFTFGLLDAGNNWWWAVDNVRVTAECAADTAAPRGSLDIFDILQFFNRFGTGSSSADLTGDGTLDIFDVLRFFAVFGGGC